MGLQEEIDKMRQEIRVDGYSMSIGEWISLYENSEIDIHPEFQRFFRWTPTQKTNLIESILLGIPIPPIFVSQREDGVWDVVDGLQRLSTIYEFVGKLKDENQQTLAPLVLEKTKYLPNLAGKKWEDINIPEESLTQTQRLLIKRSKIDATILLKESDKIAKYELFQRLNTGASIATPQEVRNCIIVMFNRDMFQWMKELSQNEMFRECIALSERPIEEQYDIELLLRFLVFRTLEEREMRKIGNDLSGFLTDKMIEMAKNENFNYSEEETAFNQTFKILYEQMGSDSFRRYSPNKDKFLGGFLVSAYEVIALGIGYNYRNLSNSTIDVREKVKQIWSSTEYTNSSGSGTTAQRRVPKLVPFGRQMFQ
ncbi:MULTISPECIES: DUF262 domain-containing protein [Cyanophyceae]|uniref:DUF262 domain-containing protein n=1 Tax=Cyanophyceae TaxID=3028117 RepID=UPI00232C68E0|nr:MULTISPECIES: DUF262 domain-containing protein [Cyanophyceae]MDB9356816.1 DUF262 domain-containing protein [Nodularia spumigena CS-587/03]MDB9305817.1 DUF262 domain-containing protein [Nodularia spumigena CS-591/12]MDB9341391.1 DUF262 domain-containing protein [Nodularia spumigena CS-589/07]MDB9402020.1 DUF262 domain-containing protein [Microcystis aeruginosa CS-567/02-A1]MDB9500911.1 DUF262 domain-containing protein [Nodularia spumigena CS-336/02]